MSNFKRASLAGSEELFRPTRPRLVDDTDEVISEAVETRPAPAPAPRVETKAFHFTEEEVALLLEAVQIAKYPERSRPKPSLDRFQQLDQLKDRLHEGQ